jgi:hypothetical protein
MTKLQAAALLLTCCELPTELPWHAVHPPAVVLLHLWRRRTWGWGQTGTGAVDACGPSWTTERGAGCFTSVFVAAETCRSSSQCGKGSAKVWFSQCTRCVVCAKVWFCQCTINVASELTSGCTKAAYLGRSYTAWHIQHACWQLTGYPRSRFTEARRGTLVPERCLLQHPVVLCLCM